MIGNVCEMMILSSSVFLLILLRTIFSFYNFYCSTVWVSQEGHTGHIYLYILAIYTGLHFQTHFYRYHPVEKKKVEAIPSVSNFLIKLDTFI